MPATDFLRSSAKNLHQNLSRAVSALTDEQVHFRPLEMGNHIGFIIWHLVRTEDIVINAFLRKAAPLWDAEGWGHKVGVESRAQGTGMPAEQAARIRIPNFDQFVQYMGAVFQATEDFLDGVNEGDLEVVNDLPMLGKQPVIQTLGGVILQHGANHLGEIYYIKGLQGLKGSPM